MLNPSDVHVVGTFGLASVRLPQAMKPLTDNPVRIPGGPAVRFCGLLAAAAIVALGVSGCGGGGGSASAPVRPGEPPPPVPVREVRVIDADTVDIDGTRYRLFGIDAPEGRQTCRAWGRTWDCGAAATEALRSRADGMSCAGSETDRYGRTIGVCSSGGEDLNAWLVANGWALAYRQYADDYVDEEAGARSNGRGIHRGAFVAPWDWRRGGRLGGADTFSWVASAPLDAGALADRLLSGDERGFDGQLLDESVFGIVERGIAVSFGARSGANPAGMGGGAWRGRVVGTDGGVRIEGDASIDIDDFARPDVDVAFTGMAGADGRARPDLGWDGLPLLQGAFRARDAAGSIEGRFWGPGQEEAGGVFEKNGMVGAFGATKQ